MIVTERARNGFRDEVAIEMDFGRTEWAGLPCGLCLWSTKASLEKTALSKFCQLEECICKML